MKTTKKIKSLLIGFAILAIAFLVFGCSSDDSTSCECNGKFYSPKENKYHYECGNKTDKEGYYFVECVSEPNY